MVAERKMEYGMPPKPSESMPYGFMAGYSKRVLHMLMACEMADKARRLMGLLVEEGFGNAGREIEHPEEAGLWVNVDTASWAGTLNCKRQYISQLIAQLIDLQMVSQHQPPAYDKNDPRTFVSSRLRINPTFEEWKPLDPDYCTAYHERRFVRSNAGYPKGRKRKETGERKVLDIQQAGVKNWISDSQDSDTHAPAMAISSKSKTLASLAKNEPETVSKTLASLAPQIQNFNPACSDTGIEAAPTGVLLKITEEVITEEEETYMVAGATQASIFPEEEKPQTKEKPSSSKPKPTAKKRTKTELLLERRPELRPLHEMAVRLFGKPMGLPAIDWANYLEELGDRPVTAEQLEAASRWYRQRYRGMSHSLKAVTGHYHEYEQALIQPQEGAEQNGQYQQREHQRGADENRGGRGYNDATQAALNRLRAKREADQQGTTAE